MAAQQQEKMEMNKAHGGPAFPHPGPPGERDNDGMKVTHWDGMSLREWYAGQCIAALIPPGHLNAEKTAQQAVDHADALLKELEKRP